MKERPTSPLLERALAEGEVLLWSGRPKVGLGPGDLVYVALWSALGFLLVALGCFALRGGPPGVAVLLGAGVAFVLFFVLLPVRLASASTLNAVLLAVSAPALAVAVLASTLQGDTADVTLRRLFCPIGTIVVLFLWIAARWLKQRDTRFHLSARRAFVEEVGSYVISFTPKGPPGVRIARFSGGRLGSIEFEPAPAKLLTKQGREFLVPETRRRFERVLDPLAALDALQAAGVS